MNRTLHNANPTFPANFKRALEAFDVNEDGLIDYAEFVLMERRYPLILFPAFQLQDTMQKHSLGETNWVKIQEKYASYRALEEFKANHNGRAPVETATQTFMKNISSIFTPSRTTKVGDVLD